MQIHQFENAAELNEQFAHNVRDILGEAITKRGQAYLAVSGGKTPQGLFQALATLDLDWKRVTITLTDERCINPTESDSNERMVTTYLLQNKAAAANFISLYKNNHCSDNTTLAMTKHVESLPTFDVVILGMGEDGHTASLFPCSSEINVGLDDSCASALIVNPVTAPYRRISLSKVRLLNSRVIFLHIVGEKKLTVLNRALSGQNSLEMPIRAFLNHPTANVQVMFAP